MVLGIVDRRDSNGETLTQLSDDSFRSFIRCTRAELKSGKLADPQHAHVEVGASLLPAGHSPRLQAWISHLEREPPTRTERRVRDRLAKQLADQVRNGVLKEPFDAAPAQLSPNSAAKNRSAVKRKLKQLGER